MKKLILIGSIAVFTSCNYTTDKKEDNSSTSIEEGKRLVTALGCNDCHSPKKMTKYGPIPDENLLLSGHPKQMELVEYDISLANSGAWILFNVNGTAAVGPWGTSYASNLTPDKTGLENWTVEQFIRAMQEGKSKGQKNGRFLLPPMPWMGYKSLKNEELTAIFNYLQSLKPIDNLVPGPLPPQ